MLPTALKPDFSGLYTGQLLWLVVQAAGMNLWQGSKLLATFLRKSDWLVGGAEGGESRQKQAKASSEIPVLQGLLDGQQNSNLRLPK